MSTRVLTIASQKGGTGQTTLTTHLAVEAEYTGAGPVAIVDTDPQGSLAAWWNTRAAETPLFAAMHIVQLQEHLVFLRERGINLVVIDTPPAARNSKRYVAPAPRERPRPRLAQGSCGALSTAQQPLRSASAQGVERRRAATLMLDTRRRMG